MRSGVAPVILFPFLDIRVESQARRAVIEMTRVSGEIHCSQRCATYDCHGGMDYQHLNNATACVLGFNRRGGTQSGGGSCADAHGGSSSDSGAVSRLFGGQVRGETQKRVRDHRHCADKAPGRQCDRILTRRAGAAREQTDVSQAGGA